MAEVLQFFISAKEVAIFAIAILLVALFAYQSWFRPALDSVASDVLGLTKLVKETEWSGAEAAVQDYLQKRPDLESYWRRTQERVGHVSIDGQMSYVTWGRPSDIWNAPDLLTKRFNIALADSVPNLLVGVGLFFTFVFLSWALVDATLALTQDGVDADQTKEAISNLLKAAGGKFLTSLSGLMASLMWTFFAKRRFRKVEMACDAFLNAFAMHVSTNAYEVIALKQMNAGDDHLGVLDELLIESREQTGTFKRFETDLAVSLAAAINKGLSPQLEQMTTKLVAAVNGLTDKLGAMNQDALQQMMTDFALMLERISKTQMAELQGTLSDLAEALKSAAENLTKGGKAAGDAIDGATKNLVDRLAEVANGLSTGAQNMETAAQSIKLAMNDLDATISGASAQGQRGAQFVTSALEQAEQTIGQLHQVSHSLGESMRGLNDLGSKFENVVDNISELANEQRQVVLEVKATAPSTLAALQQAKEAMAATSNTLSAMVDSITEGIGSYTGQVADLHREMDKQFATAVANFDKAVSDLNETLEELSELAQQYRLAT